MLVNQLVDIKEPVNVVTDERGRVFVAANRNAGIAMFDIAGALA